MPKHESPVEHALKQCSFYPLLLITAKVLSCSGFGDVQIMDRRQTTEKTRFGGFEIQCVGSFAGQNLRTVVKVIPDSIRLRMLDENAGAVIRTDADLGLVVSPFHLTRLAAQNLKSYHGARIEVLDGKALAGLMTRFQIGVRPNGEPDYAFFGGIEEDAEHLLTLVNQLTYDN